MPVEIPKGTPRCSKGNHLVGLLLSRAKRKWMCMSKWELALTFSINKEGPSAFEESHILLNKGIRVRCTMFCFVPFNFKSLESISHLCRADAFTNRFLLTHLPLSVSSHPMSFGKTLNSIELLAICA